MTIETKEQKINDYLYNQNYEYGDKNFDIKKTSKSSSNKTKITHYAIGRANDELCQRRPFGNPTIHNFSKA